LRVAAETDEAHFPLIAYPAKGWNRFINNLLHGDELDVVTQNNIQMIGAEAVQANIDALRDAFGAEVKMLQIIASEFGAEYVAVTTDIAQSDTEEDFAHAAAVKRRSVDEVKSAGQRHANTFEGFIKRNAPKLLTEGGSAKAKDGKLEAGFSERTSLHGAELVSPRRAGACDGCKCSQLRFLQR